MDFTNILSGQRRYVLANQLLRAGTAVGALMEEAQSPESRADFLHKCKIAAKEANESAYWLRLCRKSPTYPTPPVELEELAQSILRVLSKIMGTTHRNA